MQRRIPTDVWQAFRSALQLVCFFIPANSFVAENTSGLRDFLDEQRLFLENMFVNLENMYHNSSFFNEGIQAPSMPFDMPAISEVVAKQRIVLFNLFNSFEVVKAREKIIEGVSNSFERVKQNAPRACHSVSRSFDLSKLQDYLEVQKMYIDKLVTHIEHFFAHPPFH